MLRESARIGKNIVVVHEPDERFGRFDFARELNDAPDDIKALAPSTSPACMRALASTCSRVRLRASRPDRHATRAGTAAGTLCGGRLDRVPPARAGAAADGALLRASGGAGLALTVATADAMTTDALRAELAELLAGL